MYEYLGPHIHNLNIILYVLSIVCQYFAKITTGLNEGSYVTSTNYVDF
jgi:hypothetical protein